MPAIIHLKFRQKSPSAVYLKCSRSTHVKLSTCTARVLLCLYEKGLQFELVPVDLASSAHKKEPFLSLNPFGLLPAFEDGNFVLFESRAINRYVSRKYKDNSIDLLRLENIEESATVDAWMEVEAHQFDRPMQAVIHQIIVNPIYGMAPNQEIIKNEMGKVEKVLDVYEQRLKNCKYLGGDYYTLADLHHIPYLVYFMRTPNATVLTSRPYLNAWWEDISSRPASTKVVELKVSKFEVFF